MTAGILHADLDAFYASVEQRDRPELAQRPIAVGGGVILAASYEARAQGVRCAMGIRAARAACPDLIVVEPRMDAYVEASRQVFEVFHDTSPHVEPLSVDEAFLDVSGLGKIVGPPMVVAQRLRDRVTDEVGLPLSVGIARTKFLAKVASGVAKPEGVTLVEPDDELEFLHPLDVSKLWGVGPATATKLNAEGITTVGDVALLDEPYLISLLGPGQGRHIYALSHNRDPRPIIVGKRRSSIGAQRALGRSNPSPAELKVMLLQLVDTVSKRLRDGDRVAHTVIVRFRFGDYQSDTRTHSLPEATSSTAALLDAAKSMLEQRRSEIEERNLTLIGFTVANLMPADAVQQSLPFDHRFAPAYDDVLDAVRDKYGNAAIGRTALLGQRVGPAVPVLADPGERQTN